MIQIPGDQRLVTDADVFAAFNLTLPGLKKVADALDMGNKQLAKKALVHYFETRTNAHYLYDYRTLPLTPIDTDSNPYAFQACLGLSGSLKDFCLFSGNKLMEHIYVRPGRERMEIDLGPGYENLPHFNYYTDMGKKHRTIMDIFVRGQLFEYLAVLYHETGSPAVLNQFKEVFQVFFHEYPLIIEDIDFESGRFSMTDERDIMSTGWLATGLLGLLYTRLPYEAGTDLAFELIKHLWYLGIQFRRFDHTPYHPYNHHLWEKGLVPYILGTVLPEIPDFAAMKDHGAQIITRHVVEDFNERGGYNEHSIPYWGGAALGEMLYRGIYIARVNGQPLLDEEAGRRISRTFDALALISPPSAQYPSVGDNGGLSVDPILSTGIDAVQNPYCRQVLDIRKGASRECSVPLDFCDDLCGFACSRDSYGPDGNYFLISVKNHCGESGHNHMDMLSLSVSFGGVDFIGEPYARSLYHKCRAGKPSRGYLYNQSSHNSVLAYGQPIVPDFCFMNKWGVYRPDSPVDCWITASDGVYLDAHHDAYTFCRHERSLWFHRRKGLLIQDTIHRGNRLESPHIQRFHLMPGVSCTRQSDHSVLLEKNEVRVLCFWPGDVKLDIWKKTELCPEFVPTEDDLGFIIDASFTMFGRENGDLAAVSQSMAMLNATESIPSEETCLRILSTAVQPENPEQLSQILAQF
ncbi:MAG: heparinase II/III family protein [Lachnospiraceae bacterium]|nr:heparinase II/III family protein [Lachnospiraceae bacterium]